MNHSSESVLRELGFTDGEIKVYYALFDLGESRVGPISKSSGVTHGKVYPILEKLIAKGLVSTVIKEGRQHFSATHPSQLLEFVDDKVRSLEEEKSRIKTLIPELLRKQRSHEETQYSRVFVGLKGLKALFRELFENHEGGGEINSLGLTEALGRPDMIAFFKFYHELRIKKKVALKLILNTSAKPLFDEFYQPTGQYPQGTVKFVEVVYPVGVYIFKDHVVHILPGTQVTAFDQKSMQLADRYRKFHASLWNKK